MLDNLDAHLREQGLDEHQASAASLWLVSVWTGQQDESSFADFVDVLGGEERWTKKHQAAILDVLQRQR